jgi:pimeloyl-ACP methyl ester carboxylesterase
MLMHGGPALVMAGRHDFLGPPEHQDILADRVPRAQLVIVEHAGCNPHMEQTAEVIEVINSFLADVKHGCTRGN